MDPRAILQQEAKHEVSTRLLVRSVNARLQIRPAPGELWVRLRPPSRIELDNDSCEPFRVKFNRVGSVTLIAEVLIDFVEIVCAGDSLVVTYGDFLDTWIKINQWPG